MKETPMEKLEKVLDQHYECTKESAKKILEELRIGSKNYGELNKALEMFKKYIFFNQVNIKKNECVFVEIERILNKEMNGLPLTNRSEEVL